MPHFRVLTDHKPLVGIFKQNLQELHNARLSRYREKLVDYNFFVEWTSGKTNLIADALSRAPVFDSVVEESASDIDSDAAAAAVCYKIVADPALQFVYDAIDGDPVYRLLKAVWVSNEDPKRHQSLSPYYSVWDRLSLCQDYVVLDHHRIIVPKGARADLVRLLHVPHTGIVKTLANAKQLYFWPGMANDIKLKIAGCDACTERLPSLPKESLQPTFAHEPMQYMDCDLFSCHGQDWLIMADRFSGYPFAERLPQGTSTDKVIRILLRWFQDYGFPRGLRTDNGPQFRDRFALFCKKHHILLDNSSPYNPQSNGLAEAAVKNIKFLLGKCHENSEDFRNALLEWRSCPRADGFSPAEAFFGRRLRGGENGLPMLNTGYGSFDLNSFSELRNESRITAQRSGRDLPQFCIGEHVVLQNPISKKWDSKGVIMEVCSTGRSYILTDEDGRVLTRNRRFLRRRSISPEFGDDPEFEQIVDSPEFQQFVDQQIPNEKEKSAEPRRSARQQIPEDKEKSAEPRRSARLHSK